MTNTDFKIIVCAAIANKENKILLARRKAGKILGGLWEFPGGKLEHGEELEAALKRELREELSIDVAITELALIKPYRYDHGAVLILFYLADFRGGEIKLVDHDDVRWLDVNEITKFKLLPANEEMIAILKKHYG